jgi:predicted ArsR family transcriptional regulator
MTAIDFNGLDTVVHGPVRLGVITALHAEGPLDFTTLVKRFSVADGAMGVHLRKLEEAGYVACRRQFVGRRPKSTYRITTAGRRALGQYLDTMQRIIDLAQGTDASAKSTAPE